MTVRVGKTSVRGRCTPRESAAKFLDSFRNYFYGNTGGIFPGLPPLHRKYLCSPTAPFFHHAYYCNEQIPIPDSHTIGMERELEMQYRRGARARKLERANSNQIKKHAIDRISLLRLLTDYSTALYHGQPGRVRYSYPFR